MAGKLTESVDLWGIPVIEMAKPTKAMTGKIYYHGTSREASAMKIWEEGILPDLSTTPMSHVSRPVAGRVYMATNLKEAIPYMLGGSFAESEAPADLIKKEGRYGYIFVIPGSALVDVHPDEDQVGKAVHDNKLPWISKYRDSLADEPPYQDDEDMAELAVSLLDQVDDGEYTAWIKAGHILLPMMSDKEKRDIIRIYGNIAHQGKVFPTEMWRFEKKDSVDLEADGGNFKSLATLVAKRDAVTESSSSNSEQSLEEMTLLHEGLSLHELEAKGYAFKTIRLRDMYAAVVFYDGKQVGHLVYELYPNTGSGDPSREGFHEVDRAEVDVDHRNKGIYQQLLKTARDHVHSLGSKGIMSLGHQRSKAATDAWQKVATLGKKTAIGRIDFFLEDLGESIESPIKSKIIGAAQDAAREAAPADLWGEFDEGQIDLARERFPFTVPPEGASEEEIGEFYDSGLGQIETQLWYDSVEQEKAAIRKEQEAVLDAELEKERAILGDFEKRFLEIFPDGYTNLRAGGGKSHYFIAPVGDEEVKFRISDHEPVYDHTYDFRYKRGDLESLAAAAEEMLKVAQTHKWSLSEGARGDWEKEGYKIIIGDPFIHKDGEEYVVDVISPDGDEVGYFKFNHWYDHPSHGEILHVMEAEVYTAHRRKGIASAVYQKMEELTGVKIHNEPDQQSSNAKALWSQPKRPFGEGARGDWEKEGYIISHEIDGNTITVTAKKNGEIVGELYARAAVGNLKALNLEVKPQHRRKGLATALYQRAEEVMGIKFVRGVQSSNAKALWSQPNRPFGESVDSWGLPTSDRVQSLVESEGLKSVSELKRLVPELAKAAQAVYDDWGMDEFGNVWCRHQEGPGGICHLIADEMISVISGHGFDCTELSHDSMVHVSVLVKTAEGVAEVDIDPYRYETGGGYSWKKIPDVQFDPEDVTVHIINRDPEVFDQHLEEY